MARSSSRVVSLSTNYTGVAGVHSEVGTCTAAKNKAFDRRVSDTLTTEQILHMKQLSSLTNSKKSLEQSMLAYTQKMQAILDKRTKHECENTSASPSDVTITKPKARTSVAKSSSSNRTRQLPFIYDLSSDVPINNVAKSSSAITINVDQSTVDHVGRMSIDSGISMDSRSESSDTCYFSDTDCQHLYSRTPRDYVTSVSPNSVGSGNSMVSTQSDNTNDTTRIARQRRARRNRLGAGNKPELPTVDDTEHSQSRESLENSPANESHVSIAPFPEREGLDDELVPSYLQQLEANVDDAEDQDRRTRILNPLTNTKHWISRDVNTQKQTAPSVTRPKVLNSPSVTSTRLRRMTHKKKASKPFHRLFKYSDYMENIEGSPDLDTEDDDREDIAVTKAPSLPDLTDAEFDEILDLQLDRLYEQPQRDVSHRERSWSLPAIRKTRSVITLLGNLEENDAKALKSVLKTSVDSENSEKKSVRFHLPDILQGPNTCR